VRHTNILGSFLPFLLQSRGLSLHYETQPLPGGKPVGSDANPRPMLDDLIQPEHLASLAGTTAYKRGEAYFGAGRAALVIDEPDRVAGTVAGSGAEPYYGQIQARDGRLTWVCSCPVGERGEFCMHLVALALARLAAEDADAPADAPPRPAAGAKKTKRATQEEEIRAFLEGQDKARLVAWLLEVARADRATRERLLLAARVGGPASELKKLITQVTRTGDYVGYHAMPGFARRVDGMIDALEQRHGAELMGLAEYAIDRLHQALEACDDSDGYLGGFLERLVKLHVRACGEARPEPVAFARWLFERQMQDEWGTWPGVEAYATVLGEAGLSEYTRLARAEWERLPALGPGDADKVDWQGRFRIKGIMQRLAELTGDPEAMVEVERKDLSHAYAYLRIAEIYRDAGRHDAALDWAEQGLAAFRVRPDKRLQDFLVEAYFSRGWQEKAMALAWAQFTGPGAGGAEDYRVFMQRAGRTAEAAIWRQQARAFLRERAMSTPQRYGSLYGKRPQQPDSTQLVMALMGDKDPVAALAAAQEGACQPDILVDLAHALAPSQPEEAIALYRRVVDPIVERKNNQAYAEAAAVMRAARTLYVALGRAQAFGDWLAEVRLAHKPKRNFIKLLDAL
jgi:uncharacterized Zn finger protein